MSSGGKSGGKGGSDGSQNDIATLDPTSNQDRLKFIETVLLNEPGLCPNYIVFTKAGPIIIDVDELINDKLKINKLAKFDTEGGAISVVLLRMAVDKDGTIAGKEISGKLCELLTAGRTGLPCHPNYTVVSSDQPASQHQLRELKQACESDHACTGHVMRKNQEHKSSKSVL